jgi:hypothetical protein
MCCNRTAANSGKYWRVNALLPYLQEDATSCWFFQVLELDLTGKLSLSSASNNFKSVNSYRVLRLNRIKNGYIELYICHRMYGLSFTIK